MNCESDKRRWKCSILIFRGTPVTRFSFLDDEGAVASEKRVNAQCAASHPNVRKFVGTVSWLPLCRELFAALLHSFPRIFGCRCVALSVIETHTILSKGHIDLVFIVRVDCAEKDSALQCLVDDRRRCLQTTKRLQAPILRCQIAQGTLLRSDFHSKHQIFAPCMPLLPPPPACSSDRQHLDAKSMMTLCLHGKIKSRSIIFGEFPSDTRSTVQDDQETMCLCASSSYWGASQQEWEEEEVEGGRSRLSFALHTVCTGISTYRYKYLVLVR